MGVTITGTMRFPMRAVVFGLLCAGAAAGHAAAQQASTSFDVPAGPLSAALNQFGTASGVQLVYDSAIAADLSSEGVSGAMSNEEALSQLLSSTGLTYRFTTENTVVIEAAESAAFPSLGQQGDVVVLDSIIVTARRTEEAFQDVPASVFVLDGEQIDRSNITDTDDLSLLTPNVDFSANDNPARIFFSIRGITDLNAVSTGPTIGFFQDGVLQNNSGQVITQNRRIVDVERVEVLYGPQGTAFGRGTIGGAINVVTKKPSDEFEASLRTEFGSRFDFTGEAILNIPVTEDLAFRAVAYGSLSDGFVDLPFGETEDSVGDENTGGRFSLRYTPTDRLSVDTTIQVDRTAVDGPTFSIEESVLDSDPASLRNLTDELVIERLNLRNEVGYRFDVGLLRATTAFNRATFEGDEDFDLTPANNSISLRDTKETSFSQELRFESSVFELPSGLGTVSTNVGAVYNDISVFNEPGFVTNAFGTPGGNQTTSRTDIENMAVFGDVRWRPIERLELAAGARFSRDTVAIESDIAPSGSFAQFVQPLTFFGDEAFTSFTPNSSVLYEWTDNFSTYFSFSTGYRSGGFVGTLIGAPIQFDEEKVQNFEGGFKSTWLDGRLLVNGTGYALFYEDIQVPINQAAGGGIENAARARSIGAEITVGAEPIPGLSLQAGLGLAYAKFTDFPDSSVPGDPDQTGERLPRAPRTSLSFIGEYEHPVPIAFDVVPFGRVEYSYRSDYSTAVGADTALGSFDVTNLRTGFRGENLEVTFFVENVFNEVYATESVFPAFVANPAVPDEFAGQVFLVPGPTRRFGVEALIRF
ncbi:MAG: TonB-dependent receptor [Pseudomonadota bacterium]